MGVENWLGSGVQGLLGVCSFEDSNLSVTDLSGSPSEEDLLATADKTFTLFAAMCQLDGACTMIARTGGRMSFASKRGATIVESAKGLNIGLLLREIKDDAEMSCEMLPRAEISFDTSADRTIWAILERLGRTCVPRLFHLSSENTNARIYASSEGLHLISGADSAAEIVAQIRSACDDGTPVQYTLDELPDGPSGPEISLADFLARDGNAAATDAADWQLSPTGWIESCPENSTMPAMAHMAALGQALRAWQDDAPTAQLQIRDASGAAIYEVASEAEKTTIISKGEL